MTVLDPDFLVLVTKIQKRIIELQNSLNKVLENKPDDIKSIESHKTTIRELKGIIGA